MPTIRESYAGGLPLFAVDYLDEAGERRTATFHYLREAEKFSEQTEANSSPQENEAGDAAIRRSNKVTLERLFGKNVTFNGVKL